MKSYTFASAAATVLAGAALLSGVKADVDPIVIKGQHFFYKTNGTEFFMKGVAYQQEATDTGNASAINDPLANEAGCKRDIPLLKELDTNVIRVYAIDPSKDHSKCMNMLADAGIYVVQDLSNPSNSIIRDSPEWNIDLFEGYTAVIDEMAKYTNTFGFFAGNEVSNEVNNTEASAYVKAAVRDSKAYIKTKGYRALGVGYATNDDAAIRDPLADYFNCGDAEDAIDFWGYNIYSWCGKSSYTVSGYDKRTEEFGNYSVPVFMAEYGCNEPSPRTFGEVQAIYGDKMTDVWSGGIVYMYFQEENEYGLVTIGTDDTATKLTDFGNFKSQINSVSPSKTKMADYSPTNTAARKCPAVGSAWEASSTLPPIANSQLCDCMMASLDCTTNSDITTKEIGTQFSYVCGQDPESCTGIQHNGTTGEYGAYSMCNAQQKLAFAYNQYYTRQKKSSDSCDFDGTAKIQTGAVDDTCSPLIKAAGTDGAGTVTAKPTSGSVASSTGGADAAESSSADSAGVREVNMGMLGMAGYVMAAVMVGAGMVAL